MIGTVVRIRGLKKFVDKRDGRTYCYHRASGKRLRSEFGTAEFFAELAAIDEAYKAKSKGDGLPKSLEDLIKRYLASPNFRELAAKTRKDYERLLCDLIGFKAELHLTAIDRPFVINLRDAYATHRSWSQANYLLRVLSIMFRFGFDLGVMSGNPAAGIKKLKRPQNLEQANRPWEPEEWDAMLKALPVHMRLPFILGNRLGLRISDVVRLPKTAIRDGWIIYSTKKRDVEICQPLTADIREEILRAPAHQAETLCANSQGKPWTVDGLRTNFTRIKAKLLAEGVIRKGLTFHGLRHSRASELAEHGADDKEIATWLGQQSSQMARHYSARANKKRRMEATIIKMNRVKEDRAKEEQNLSGKPK